MKRSSNDKQSSMSKIRELTENLDREECWMDSFFNASPDLLAVMTSDGHLIHTSESWHKIPYYDAENSKFSDLLHRDDIQKFEWFLGDLEYSNVMSFRCRLKMSNDYYITVEYSATKFDNDLTSVIGRISSDTVFEKNC